MDKEYDECGNLRNKECKYFHQDPYRTPNNYDLYFDYNSIPVNIEVESATDLIRRLRRYLPLSKIIHLNMENKTISHNDEINLHTKTRLKLKKVDDINGSVNDVVVELK